MPITTHKTPNHGTSGRIRHNSDASRSAVAIKCKMPNSTNSFPRKNHVTAVIAKAQPYSLTARSSQRRLRDAVDRRCADNTSDTPTKGINVMAMTRENKCHAPTVTSEYSPKK